MTPPGGSTPPTALAGLVLAAGRGSRYGGPKALVRWADELLVERAARVLAEGGCRPVAVVLGAQAERVRAAARLDGPVVVAPDWADGMSASLRAGLAALTDRAGVGAVVVALVDQPLVGPEAVARLRSAWRGGAVAAVATYAGAPRNPVLLDRAVWGEVSQAASGDEGARGWLRAAADRVARVACDGTGSPDDVDTPADLAALAAVAGPPGPPSVHDPDPDHRRVRTA